MDCNLISKTLQYTIKEIISDTSKFEKLNEDPTLNVFYVSRNKKNFFNEIEYDQLYPSGSAPARIYGTPKMHKFSSSDSFPKLCPIVSSIGTFNYNLARFLCDLLSPLVPNDYSCKDTFSFVSEIKNANLSKKFLVSYNIFMGFHESKWLNEYNLNKPKFYLRYVDDILAAFDNEEDSSHF